jgi:quercetin dioxygenase-like cupin family protein
MKLVRLDAASAEVDTSPIFIGKVQRQKVVSDEEAALLRVAAITFRNGARNRWHRHEVEQVLVVTAGHGIVATETEELHLAPGDVVLVAAGERHWHGALPGEDFTHLAILTPGALTIDEG